MEMDWVWWKWIEINGNWLTLLEMAWNNGNGSKFIEMDWS